jgi:periplasmic divalent cation tolerance protein
MSNPSELCLIYVVLAGFDEAVKIAKTLLAEKLCGCVNILPNITSIYHWNDELQTENEVAMLVKTNIKNQEAAMQRIKQLHSYQTPCIITLGINAVNADFAHWLSGNIA